MLHRDRNISSSTAKSLQPTLDEGLLLAARNLYMGKQQRRDIDHHRFHITLHDSAYDRRRLSVHHALTFYTYSIKARHLSFITPISTLATLHLTSPFIDVLSCLAIATARQIGITSHGFYAC
jgi:hypothetical protein